MRKVDIVARYGGEEFVAILPETSAEGGVVFAERLRERIEAQAFDVGRRAHRAFDGEHWHRHLSSAARRVHGGSVCPSRRGALSRQVRWPQPGTLPDESLSHLRNDVPRRRAVLHA